MHGRIQALLDTLKGLSNPLSNITMHLWLVGYEWFLSGAFSAILKKQISFDGCSASKNIKIRIVSVPWSESVRLNRTQCRHFIRTIRIFVKGAAILRAQNF